MQLQISDLRSLQAYLAPENLGKLKDLLTQVEGGAGQAPSCHVGRGKGAGLRAEAGSCGFWLFSYVHPAVVYWALTLH